MDLDAFLWLVIDVVFVAVLAAALVYGAHQWRRRRKDGIAKEVEEKAVDRAYRD
jgi:hypothetical protein